MQVAVAIGLAVAWLALWRITLRRFGIPVLGRTKEEHVTARERFLRMGKQRYILIVGVLGYGFAFALGINFGIEIASGAVNWVRIGARLAIGTVLFGWWYGVRTWNESVRGEVPFPPYFPPHQ